MKSGDILAGWCSCIGGRCEASSHISALLFNLELITVELEKLPCTSKANVWRPPYLKEVECEKIVDMDFTPPEVKRRRHVNNDVVAHEPRTNNDDHLLRHQPAPIHLRLHRGRPLRRPGSCRESEEARGPL